MLERIDQLEQQSMTDLARVADAAALEQFRIQYLGTKGAMKALMGLLKDVPADQKPRFGQRANALRQKLEAAFAQRKAELDGGTTISGEGHLAASASMSGSGTVSAAAPGAGGASGASGGGGGGRDVTETGLPARLGRTHVISQTIEELIGVFGRMGFDVATGPEVEDDWHNFVALNIPAWHPARDPLDNYFLRQPKAAASGTSGGGGASGVASGGSMLRSQTSTIQIRVMETCKPPVRVVALGRVYRPDEHDATHYSMFHQIEGLYVDRKVSMADLKTTLLQFARAYFGADAEVRLTPSYFPFTEPSAEMYVKMHVGGQFKWVELGGCGMVDPNVFKAVGYDPEQWTGFAFGLGIERIAMRKFGITDIRWLFENDIRFLRQF
ncbi:MAG: phenylalanine--tRNA ligase subunit alpha [Phycisphaeraceae bacterium]|nr:phenylalanine--tRNA ligase subunit alpha [Phycisphaeraceae bacterium]